MKRSLFYLVLIVCIQVAAGCSESSEPEDKFTPLPDKLEILAGTPESFGHEGEGGPAEEAKLGTITALAADGMGKVYFTDAASNTVHVVNMSLAAVKTIEKVGGTFVGFDQEDPTPFFGDGGPATSAHLNSPQGLTVDKDGNVIVADASNFRVRKISTDGNISTIAGTGDEGFGGNDGPATAATIGKVQGMATDLDGNIYFADTENNVIRKITRSTGIISIVAGLGPDEGGFSGDNGPAIQARLDAPSGVAILGDEIYIADAGNHRIREISNGVIRTIAGTGNVGFTGENESALSATFGQMKGIAAAYQSIFVCDASNSAVREISLLTGKIRTIAGTGVNGFDADILSPTNTKLSNPQAIAVNSNLDIFIGDAGNNIVRVMYMRWYQ
jgi:sugar lactone lactonase YvrE